MGSKWFKCSCCGSTSAEPPQPKKRVDLTVKLVSEEEKLTQMRPMIEEKIEKDASLHSLVIADKAAAERHMSALVPRLFFSRAEIDGFCLMQSSIALPLYQYYTKRITALECNHEIMCVLMGSSSGYIQGLVEVFTGSFTTEFKEDSGWSAATSNKIAIRFGFKGGEQAGEDFLSAIHKEKLLHNPAEQIITSSLFLGVSPSATLKELQGAFQKLIRKYHPNKTPNPQYDLFVRLIESYFLIWFYLYSGADEKS